MEKQHTVIKFEVTFELKDFDKFRESYPNFIYNYDSFEEWAMSNIKYLKGSIADIEGYKLTIKQLKNI